MPFLRSVKRNSKPPGTHGATAPAAEQDAAGNGEDHPAVALNKRAVTAHKRKADHKATVAEPSLLAQAGEEMIRGVADDLETHRAAAAAGLAARRVKAEAATRNPTRIVSSAKKKPSRLRMRCRKGRSRFDPSVT